jgi:hypothetical protein
MLAIASSMYCLAQASPATSCPPPSYAEVMLDESLTTVATNGGVLMTSRLAYGDQQMTKVIVDGTDVTPQRRQLALGLWRMNTPALIGRGPSVFDLILNRPRLPESSGALRIDVRQFTESINTLGVTSATSSARARDVRRLTTFKPSRLTVAFNLTIKSQLPDSAFAILVYDSEVAAEDAGIASYWFPVARGQVEFSATEVFGVSQRCSYNGIGHRPIIVGEAIWVAWVDKFGRLAPAVKLKVSHGPKIKPNPRL